MKIRPLGDRLLVLRFDEDADKSEGGIIIPDTAKEKPQRGKIVAVGQGKLDDDGKRVPMDVKEGDEVIFGKYSGNEVKADGVEYLIMRQDDIYGVVE